ncbi:PREDICTED: uncharacterized protein LOC105953533 isoform X2 [Erythranthe guttata]|nr:PREDICTED: uncharacterized protein LOC105953533 isoform X2 [Erythranthe guttata]|eukprot:XP_012832659.1 PREDICTED: uncharacterized protein LOC105953533 isoform X2 [Erythranthe guttata]
MTNLSLVLMIGFGCVTFGRLQSLRYIFLIYVILVHMAKDHLIIFFFYYKHLQKISETQSNNRDKLKNHHKLGTKSRAAHQFENSLDDIDMYEAEYRNGKNGWASEVVEANSAKMKALREEQRALPDGVDRMSTEQICITVLGENSSYAKCKGLNRKSSRSDVCSSFESSSSRARLEEELVSTQAELSNTKVELSSQKTTVEALVKCVENLTGKSLSEIINLPK